MTRVFIADSSFIVREGLKALIAEIPNTQVVGEASSSGELIPMIVGASPDILFINYATPLMVDSDVELVLNTFSHTKVIGITDRPEADLVRKQIKSGIDGHLLYSCDKFEYMDAIRHTLNGERFFCGKVLEVLDKENNTKTFTCGGTVLTKREIEVIELVAQGMSNKQIADEMFVSVHTVLTHRKNLMQKLGVKNTAGLVIYAVQSGIHTASLS